MSPFFEFAAQGKAQAYDIGDQLARVIGYCALKSVSDREVADLMNKMRTGTLSIQNNDCPLFVRADRDLNSNESGRVRNTRHLFSSDDSYIVVSRS